MDDPQPETSESAANTPRWVKAFGIVALALILLFVVLHLTGHGVGDHMR